MPFSPDHSGNFPSEFSECPKCGKKGLYHINTTQTIKGVDSEGSFLEGVVHIHFDRCKYCGHYERLSA